MCGGAGSTVLVSWTRRPPQVQMEIFVFHQESVLKELPALVKAEDVSRAM